MIDKNVELVHEAYLELINPINIYNMFKTNNCFINWLQQGNKTDLEHTLTAFEKEEMYEQCEIIKNLIKNKK